MAAGEGDPTDRILAQLVRKLPEFGIRQVPRVRGIPNTVKKWRVDCAQNEGLIPENVKNISSYNNTGPRADQTLSCDTVNAIG